MSTKGKLNGHKTLNYQDQLDVSLGQFDEEGGSQWGVSVSVTT